MNNCTSSVLNIVRAFGDEQGVSGDLFKATSNLVGAVFGENAESVFIHYVEMKNYRFYIPNKFVEACVNDILNCLKQEGK